MVNNAFFGPHELPKAFRGRFSEIFILFHAIE